jgi:lipoprotein-releasing system permease protein
VKILPIPAVVAAVAAVVASLGFLALRARLDFGRKETTRGILQSVCAVLGALFLGFTYWTERLPLLRGSAWTVRDAVVRAAAIFTGVLFLVGTVVALLPWAFDRLERGAFASFVAARHVRARKSGFLTLISALSIFAVALASFSLSGAISVMGGFSARSWETMPTSSSIRRASRAGATTSPCSSGSAPFEASSGPRPWCKAR